MRAGRVSVRLPLCRAELFSLLSGSRRRPLLIGLSDRLRPRTVSLQFDKIDGEWMIVEIAASNPVDGTAEGDL